MVVVVSGCLTIFQILLQPHAWKLWVDAVTRPVGCHEYKVCYNTLDKSIGKPWCYRLLSAWMVWLGHKIVKNMFVLLVLIRFLQNVIIVYLFQKYSLVSGHLDQFNMILFLTAAIIGYVGTDFRLNTHNETIFLLLSVLYIDTWLLFPIAILAALNRETYGLFYLMAFFVWGFAANIVISFFVFVVVVLGVRLFWTTDKLTCPQFTPGWKLVKANLTAKAGLLNCFAYFGLLWIYNIEFTKLSVGIIAMGVVNFICNLWYGNIRETALFINPYILLIPFI